LEPKEAALICKQAITDLNQTMSKQTSPADLFAQLKLASGLASLASCVEPKELVEVATVLIRVMSKTTTNGHFWGYTMREYVSDLESVVPLLKPKEAAEVATILAQAISTTTESSPLIVVGSVLTSVISRLTPQEEAVVAANLAQVICKTTNVHGLESLAESLALLASRLEPQVAARGLGPLPPKCRREGIPQCPI
jgi:hypothetical protein